MPINIRGGLPQIWVELYCIQISVTVHFIAKGEFKATSGGDGAIKCTVTEII
jgi:hypothetical protein